MTHILLVNSPESVSDEGEIVLSIEGDTRPTIIHEGRYEGRDDIYFC